MKVIVDDIATEYRDEGRGPVVLMLHGWQDSLSTFDLLARLLTVHYRVIRLDLPGFGGTELPRGGWYVDDYIRFVERFVKKIDAVPEYMLGHSFGGRILIKGAATGSIGPRKLILIAAAGIKKFGTIRSWVFRLMANIGKVIFVIPPFSFFKDRLRGLLYAAAGSDYLRAGGLKQTYLHVIDEDLSRYAKDVTQETLLIWGDADTETPVADGQFFSRTMQHSKLVVFERHGHFVHREVSNEIARLIKEFCV